MERLYKVICEHGQEAFDIVSRVMAQDKNIFTKSELKVLKWLRDFNRNNGKYPTVNIFNEEYPEYELPEESYTLEDVGLLVQTIITERRNQEKSKTLIELASKISESGMDEESYEKLQSILEVTPDSGYRNHLEHSVEILDRVKTTSSGLITGVKAIDEKIGGMNTGSFNTVFAYTGSFKTTWALNMAYKNSYELGYNIAYITLEVPAEHVLYNLVSRHSFRPDFDKYQFIPHEKIRKNLCNEDEDVYIREVIIPDLINNSKGKLYIVDETDLTDLSFIGIEQKLREIDNLSKEQTGYGLDAVFVDQAQLLKFAGMKNIGNEGAVINAYASFFRKQCINFLGTKRQIAVIMLSQANRDGWKRAIKNEGRYDLRAISEANELERASWRIFSIYTNENMKEAKEAKICLLKNRSGGTIYEPLVTYVEPEAYVFGDEVEGFDAMLDANSLDDMFG